jgi:hypothetical protein
MLRSAGPKRPRLTRTILRRVVFGLAILAMAVSVSASLDDGHEPAEAGTSATRVVWTGNYEAGNFSQWERVLQESAGSAQIVANRVAEGQYAARFVLEPQTAATGSRIEAHQPDQVASGGVYGSETWYRWAEFVPSSTGFARHPSFNHLVQWHPDAECFGAGLSVNGLARPVRLLFNVRGGDILSYERGCDFRYERTFDLGPLRRDRWLRFRLHIKWSGDPSVGFVELWMNGGRKIKLTHLATAPPDVGHYLRQGIYRYRCTCRTVVYGDGMTVKQVDG